MASNGFNRVIVIENSTSAFPSSYGLKVIKQLRTSRRISFRLSFLSRASISCFSFNLLNYFRFTNLKNLSNNGFFYSRDGLIFISSPADSIGEEKLILRTVLFKQFLIYSIIDTYFGIIAKTRIKSSLIILTNIWTEDKFRCS